MHTVYSRIFQKDNKQEPTAKDNLQRYKNIPFIFIHINKTAGLSIGNLLELPAKMHFTAQEVIEEIGEREWRKALSFSIVRNPFEKAVSHYNYRVKTNQTELATCPLPFKDWLFVTYGEIKDPFYYDQPKMFQSQCAWLENINGRVCVDLVLRFERLNQDFQKIRKLLNVEGEIPHINKSNHRPWKDYYDYESARIIQKWFARDFAYFQYPKLYED